MKTSMEFLKSIGTVDNSKRDNQFIELLWESLNQDKEHKDRKQTGWGTKTKDGLIACINRIIEEN